MLCAPYSVSFRGDSHTEGKLCAGEVLEPSPALLSFSGAGRAAAGGRASRPLPEQTVEIPETKLTELNRRNFSGVERVELAGALRAGHKLAPLCVGRRDQDTDPRHPRHFLNGFFEYPPRKMLKDLIRHDDIELPVFK